MIVNKIKQRMISHVVFLLLIFGSPILLQAQLAAKGGREYKKLILLSSDKRVTLIFPDLIVEDVVGNSKIIVSKSKNKYFLSVPDNRGFNETSLFITLASGHYYDFKIRGKSYIDTTVYAYTAEDADGVDPVVSAPKDTLANVAINKGGPGVPFKMAEEFIANSNLVLQKPVFFTDKGVIGQSSVFFLQSIYHDNDKLYIRISAKNFSGNDYDIRDIKFHVVPVKGFLNNVVSEKHEIKPVFVLNGHKMKIERNSTLSKVYVFDKFTISDKKHFSVDIYEGNGQYKQLQFSLTQEDFEKALALK